MNWSIDDIPRLDGRVALVTGGNTGLGFRTCLELARKGARVLLGARSFDLGEQACGRIRSAVVDAQVETFVVDLLDWPAIAENTAGLRGRLECIDILVNNAGVVNLAELRRTPGGHEMHMATNHYGHFALTAGLYELLLAAPEARVVTLSSGGHRGGVIDFEDLKWERRPYNRVKSYGDSKLANLHFTVGLQKRFEAAGSKAKSVAAHPGLTGTERQQSIGVGGALSRWAASPVEKGVRPQLMAATWDGAKGGEFFGPRWGIWGAPSWKRLALDEGIGERLWEVTAEITGARFG